MGHDHHHGNSEGNIRVAFFLNLAFTLVELAGGLYTNSVAILSDALHDLGDSLSLGLSWYFQRVSKRKRTRDFSYGFRRFSLLGAVVNSVVLVVGSILILTEAIPRLYQPEQPELKGMLFLALLGIAVNGAAALRLRKGESLNEKVVSLHLLEDVLGWVAVLVGSLIMMWMDAPFIDPLLSVLITLFVLFNVWKNLKKSLRVFLQGTPEDVSVELVTARIADLPGISDIHDCHVWTLDGQYNLLTVHLRMETNINLARQAEIKADIRAALRDIPIHHFTIEFEAPEEDCNQQHS